MTGVIKISYTHDAMIDLIIARPGISNGELAAHFGYTAAWCSMIKGSDAFKARLAMRRAEIVDPELTLSLQERIQGITERAVEVLGEKLSAPASAIADSTVLRAAEFGAKALGIGMATPAPVMEPEHLEVLAKRLMSLQTHRSVQNVQDVPFIESEA